MSFRSWKTYKRKKKKEGNWNDIPVKHQVYCPYAQKQKKPYASEKAALKAIEYFQPEHENQKVQVRAYYCKGCAAWHITSRP